MSAKFMTALILIFIFIWLFFAWTIPTSAKEFDTPLESIYKFIREMGWNN